MKRYLVWLMIGGLLMAASAACDDGDDGGAPDVTPQPTAAFTATPEGPPFAFEGPVGIDLTTFGAFHNEGDPVRFAITVAASESITLYYRTAQRYDIVVTAEAGEEVWRWSKDKAFGEVLGEENLQENEFITFNETWDQRDNQGQQVPAGNYSVTATSSHCDANLENCDQLSVTGTIQIRAT
jgi:hypothetical protein